MPTPQDPLELDSIFGSDIFQLLGIQSAPAAHKQEILKVMTDTVEGRVLARILDKLTDAQIKEFEAISDQGDDRARTFLEDHDIDLVQLTAEETIIYKAQVASMVTGRSLVAA